MLRECSISVDRVYSSGHQVALRLIYRAIEKYCFKFQ
ncbi:unnamed protein product [Tenebrio molitor]|nr:unnamed protein product [Tenebrio molitor]